MTNEELKKKIVDILVNCKSDECAIEYCSECDGNPCIENCREKQQADALIAAGIGDVHKRPIDPTYEEYATQVHNLAIEEQKQRARAEAAEHRAEVYEQALYHTAISDTEYQEAIEQAEKELTEGKKDE